MHPASYGREVTAVTAFSMHFVRPITSSTAIAYNVFTYVTECESINSCATIAFQFDHNAHNVRIELHESMLSVHINAAESARGALNMGVDPGDDSEARAEVLGRRRCGCHPQAGVSPKRA